MLSGGTRLRMVTMSALLTTGTQAAPIDGELGSNAAALLLLLGVGALLMGLRNLRELRHKRVGLNRDLKDSASRHGKAPDPDTGPGS